MTGSCRGCRCRGVVMLVLGCDQVERRRKSRSNFKIAVFRRSRAVIVFFPMFFLPAAGLSWHIQCARTVRIWPHSLSALSTTAPERRGDQVDKKRGIY